MSQLVLPIDWARDGESERLLIHRGNAAALAQLRAPQRWPSHCALLVGEHASGRSMLGRLFVAEGLGRCIDDAEAVPEETLFNAWNTAREVAQRLLLIGRAAPPVWAITLPDLRTRLATAGVIAIEPPDAQVAAQLIGHGLTTRGAAFAPDMPDFVARRIARCYDVIAAATASLNADSLANGGKLSVSRARNVLGAQGLFAEE